MKKQSKITDYYQLYRPQNTSHLKTTLYQDSIQAGFPSPAEDYIEAELDLNEFFITHPSTTYILKVTGDSMIDAGIFNGDYIVVDRSLDPRNNDFVVAYVEGEFTLKRFEKKDDKTIILYPENQNYSPIIITPETDFLIWGVVTAVLRKLKH